MVMEIDVRKDRYLDSIRNIQVTVTEDDIRNGKRHCGTECPVLWALRRRFGELGYDPGLVDRVTRAYIVFNNGVRQKSARSVASFCGKFDEGGKDAVAPFTFCLSTVHISELAPHAR